MKISTFKQLTKKTAIIISIALKFFYRLGGLNMFKRTIAAIMILVMILAAVLCLAAKVDAADTRYTKDDTWLVYWYICGADNLEGGDHLATKDIAEIQRVKLPPNVKVLIAAGSTQKWHHPSIKASGHGIYLYNRNRLEKQVDWNANPNNPDTNMGNPNTLASFIKYGEEHFPADHKIIIFWDHGGLSGVCYDENFNTTEGIYPNDGLTYDELKNAFTAVYGSSPEEVPFELIGFKACLTGSYELANSLADFSHYMLGSEPSVQDWNSNDWIATLSNDPSMNGAQLGKAICNSALKSYDDAVKRIHTFSLIDLTKMSELREAYEAYFDEAFTRANEETGFSAAFARAAENRNVDKYSNIYTDLGLLAKNTKSIMPDASNKLLKAIDNAVVYNKRGDYLKSKGISTYYPYISKEKVFSKSDTEQAVSSRNAYFKYILNQNSSYSSQIELYSELLGLDVSALEDEDTVLVNRKKDGHLFAQLTPEQLESVSSIQCVMFPLNESNTPELGGAMLASADDLKIDWKKGIVTEDFRAIEPVFDGNKIVMFPSVSGRGHTFYSVPILYRVPGTVTDEEGAMQEIDVDVQRELIVRYDTATKKYEIVGFGSDIENGMVRGLGGVPEPGHVITPLYITLSDDATNEQLGLTTSIDPETGKPKTIILQSVIDSINIPNTEGKLFIKWKAGTPFVFTRNSLITDKPIMKGNYFYQFSFNAPNGENAYSYPGVISVKNGKVFRFTTEEFAQAVAEYAAKANK